MTNPDRAMTEEREAEKAPVGNSRLAAAIVDRVGHYAFAYSRLGAIETVLHALNTADVIRTEFADLAEARATSAEAEAASWKGAFEGAKEEREQGFEEAASWKAEAGTYFLDLQTVGARVRPLEARLAEAVHRHRQAVQMLDTMRFNYVQGWPLDRSRIVRALDDVLSALSRQEGEREA